MTDHLFRRRHFLAGGMAAWATAILPRDAAARVRDRRLAIVNPHNGERYDACYFENGRYRADGLAELNHAMRDWRTGSVHRMDRDLLDLLVGLRDRLDVAPHRHIKLVSGYRCPRTNQALRARSRGVAVRSQHMLGKASDIVMPGVALRRVRDAALSLRAGGVGYYPRDGFVHVDTGRVRHWG